MTSFAALAALAFMLAAPFGVGVTGAQAAEPHKVAIHIDENDPKRMNLALNNVQNIKAYYDEKGEDVTIEVVTYGPGLHMLRADTSPVANRIKMMSMEIAGLSFAACGNTRNAMAKNEGKDIPLLEDATEVPSGVVRLIELQEDGYAYVRP
ncbi:DsrE family protein [Aurantimonas marina]|uniref:DsrE family protein n=1 Tax=Aurantimonas marina TaxID=2780508 RepID=UPI001E2C7282|nr:DsrE family protein [Aurantimonas marina]